MKTTKSMLSFTQMVAILDFALLVIDIFANVYVIGVLDPKNISFATESVHIFLSGLEVEIS